MNQTPPARSVGVVVGVANRDPLLILNLMRSLGAQTRLPDAMALVNFGAPCLELEKATTPFPLMYRHLPQGPVWSITLADNQGVRLLPPVETLLFLDGDVLLAPDFIERGLRRLAPGILINCKILDLPQGAVTPETDVVREFDHLKSLSRQRPEINAVGACQWLRTKAFERLRGHDEAFKMWCFEDMDFQRRARWIGLQPVHLDEETCMLHQWHRSKTDVIKSPDDPETKDSRHWYKRNLSLLRTRSLLWDIGKFDPNNVNPDGWGRGVEVESAQ